MKVVTKKENMSKYLGKDLLGKISKSHGGSSQAMRALASDPYKVLQDAGTTLETADRVAVSLKVPFEHRVFGHARWMLSSTETISRNLLVTRIQFSMELPRYTIETLIDRVIRTGKLLAVDTHVISSDHYRKNTEIRDEIRRRSVANVHDDLSNALRETTIDDEILRDVCSRSLVVLTGGPGTGKSHIVRQILEAVGPLRSRATAPTGRAARNARGRTIHHFKTIQESGTNDFDGAWIVIVDEASMLSTDLFWNVLHLTPKDAHIVLVGDVDQLPPIQAGDVFRDVMASGKVPVHVLRVNYRCDDSGINEFARDVLLGTVRAFPELIPCDTLSEAISHIRSIPHDIVLTPHNATRKTINDAMRLPGDGDGDDDDGVVETEGCTARRGDKVIVTKNTSTACNGDMGTLVSAKHGIVEIAGGERVTIPRISKSDPGYTLSYAVTVHKAQGSEFETVIIPVFNPDAWDRTLLYTATTRAKTRAVFLGSEDDLRAIVSKPPRSRGVSVLRRLIE